MNITTKYEILDNVKIESIGLLGKIHSIWISNRGIQYEIRFIWNCEEKFLFCYENEISGVKEKEKENVNVK